MQIAGAIVKQIFTYGTMSESSSIFLRILASPEIRELSLFGRHDMRDRHAQYHPAAYWQAMQAVVASLKHYLSTILKTKGSRHTVAQRAYRTVVAACSSVNLNEMRLVQTCAKLLVSRLLDIVLA